MFAFLAAPAPAIAADSTDAAFKMCRMFDSTHMESSPCSVGVRTVTITVDMATDQAQALCTQVAGVETQLGLVFDPGWQLFINSPYSNGQSIAYCDL